MATFAIGVSMLTDCDLDLELGFGLIIGIIQLAAHAVALTGLLLLPSSNYPAFTYLLAVQKQKGDLEM